jgi:transposase
MVSEMTWISFFRSTRGLSADRFGDYAGLPKTHIIIDTVISKYCDHQPLYRQSAMLERDSGVELSRATLDGWVLKVGELLIPMASAMRQELLRGTYIQADETPDQIGGPKMVHAGRIRNDTFPRRCS